MVCIPEVPFDLEQVMHEVADTYVRGKKHCIITVAEGASPHATEIAAYLSAHEADTGFGVRLSLLGHIQRGGSPTAYDRFLATRLGAAAVRTLHEGTTGVLVGLLDGVVTATPLTRWPATSGRWTSNTSAWRACWHNSATALSPHSPGHHRALRLGRTDSLCHEIVGLP
jgi:6-phosphofructokinase